MKNLHPHLRNLWLAALAMLIAVPAAHAQLDPNVDEDLQWKIGQVLLNTLKSKEVDGGPSEELMGRFHDLGENQYGPSWGYKAEVEQSKQDGQPVTVYMSITLVPDDYELTPKQKANWKKYDAGTDDQTGGKIAFRSVTDKNSGIRRHRTTYRLVSDGIRMNMHFTREGQDGSAEAKRKSIDSWRSFIDYANRQGLFENTRIHIVVGKVQGADHEGPMEDFQVLHVRKGIQDVVKIPFTVQIESRDLESDKPYTVHLKHKHAPGFGKAKLTDGKGNALQDTDGDGYLEVQAKAPEKGGKAELTLELGRNDALRATPQELLAGPAAMIRVAHITKDKDGNPQIKQYKDVNAQTQTWAPIVSRFQVVGTQADLQRVGTEDTAENASRSFMKDRWPFSEMTSTNGTWLQVYTDHIEPIASAQGAIGKGDAVMLGWRKNPSALKKEFMVAVDDPNKTRIATVPHKSRVHLALWIDIFGTPEVKSGSFDDSGLSPDEDDSSTSTGMDPVINTATFQENLERLIFVENTKFEINRVFFIPKDMKPDEFEKQLPDLVRLAPGGPKAKNPNDPNDPVSRPVPHLQAGPSQMSFPVFREKMLVAEPVPFRDLTLTPGIYELRFSTTIFHSEESWSNQNKKSIDVGIRFAVMPSTFKVQQLDWDTRRVR